MNLPRRSLLTASVLAAGGAGPAAPPPAPGRGENLREALATRHGGSLVNFSLPGAGSVLRNIVDKFAEVRTFEDFGATGDATPDGRGTDDTAAIQKALDWSFANAGAIHMTARNFLCGNITTYPYTTIIGTGRHTSAFIARSGTAGRWFTDNGNAAKTTLSGMAWYARNLPNLTAILDLGNKAIQFGTEGILKDLFLRDAVNGDGLNVNANVGIFRDITVWNCRRGLRILGNANQLLGIVAMQSGEGSTGAIVGGPAAVAGAELYGCLVDQIEIEAPVSGAIPLRMYGDCRVSKLVISLAPGTDFSHLIEVDTGRYDEWSMIDPLIFRSSATVRNGILKVGGAYRGGRDIAAFSGRSMIPLVDVHSGALALRDQTYQEIGLRLMGDAGGLRHRMGSKGDSSAPGIYCTKVVGSSTALAATPARGARFSSGASLMANGGTLVLNTARPQDASSLTVGAQIVRQNTGEPLTVSTHVAEYSVGGVTAARLALDVWKTDGTRLILSNLPPGKIIDLTLSGYIA